MSSGFVSRGTIEDPDAASTSHNEDAWAKARREIESHRLQKDEASRAGDGQSLYDALQANKAAKQEAFEEANKLKNQFRALDEDEIEYLDSVLERTRAEEKRVATETKAGLEAFRKQQEEADRRRRSGETGGGEPEANAGEEWAAAGRKRRRQEKDAFRGLKLRKSESASSTGGTVPAKSPAGHDKSDAADVKSEAQPVRPATQDPKPAQSATAKPSLGLVSYDSDDD